MEDYTGSIITNNSLGSYATCELWVRCFCKKQTRNTKYRFLSRTESHDIWVDRCEEVISQQWTNMLMK